MSDSPDSVISSDIRLRVCAALYGVNLSTFKDLRISLNLSESGLSKCLKSLEAHAYVLIDKRKSGRKSITIVALTEVGRTAYQRRRETLKSIITE